MSTRIGKIIRKARLDKDLSQKALADNLGYTSAQFVSNWERGLANPPPASFKALRRHLGIEVSTLVSELVRDYKTRVQHEIHNS